MTDSSPTTHAARITDLPPQGPAHDASTAPSSSRKRDASELLSDDDEAAPRVNTTEAEAGELGKNEDGSSSFTSPDEAVPPPPPPKQPRTLHDEGGAGAGSGGLTVGEASDAAAVAPVLANGVEEESMTTTAAASVLVPHRHNVTNAVPESLFLLSLVGGDGGASSSRNALFGGPSATATTTTPAGGDGSLADQGGSAALAAGMMHPNTANDRPYGDHYQVATVGGDPGAGAGTEPSLPIVAGTGDDINNNTALAGTATPPPEILAAAAAAAAEVEAATAAAADGPHDNPHHVPPHLFEAGGAVGDGRMATALTGHPTEEPSKDEDGDLANSGKSKKRGRPPGGTAGAGQDSGVAAGKVGGGGRGAALPSKQACISEPFKRSFNDMLYELLRFRVNKGHLRVPPTHGNLGVWVYRLRVQHQALQRDPARRNVVDLTRERIDVLNSLEFCWDLNKYETEKNWNDRYAELVLWKEAHGHCNVPQSDPNLGKWVKMQRDYYNNTAEGRTQRKGSLTQDKIEKLEAIGFEWRLLKMVGWDKRFDELCEWKRLHGHCNVPTQTSGSLGRWVSKQRIQMTYRKNGEYSQLSDDRIERLNSIGFVWNTKLKSDIPDDMEPPHQYLYDDSMAI